MTGGARVAAAEGGGRRSGLVVGRCWAKTLTGCARRRKRKAGCTPDWAVELGWKRPAREGGLVSSFFNSNSLFKQANQFEFKPGFESKHPKTMHRHECNTHNYLFDLENQSKDFSYTIFPVKKNKSWAKF
jgi:hypothetical protein